MAKIVCFGEMLLRLSAPGNERLFQTPNLDVIFGGAEANAGVCLARFGNEVSYVTTLPDNAVGDACAGRLMEQGVSVSNVVRLAGRMAIYFLETGAMLRPSAITYDRAGSAFAEADPAVYDWPKLLSGAEWLHVCGISLAVSEASGQAVLDAVKAANAMGVKVSFDCNYRPSLWAGREADGVEKINQVIDHADLVFGGHRDAGLLLGFRTVSEAPADKFADAGKALFDRFERLSAIATTSRVVRSANHNTLSGLFQTRNTLVTTPTYDLHGIVDRIGTGDAFAGGVLHGIANRKTDQETIEYGVAAAALKHSIPGDFGLLRLSEVEAFRRSSGGDVIR